MDVSGGEGMRGNMRAERARIGLSTKKVAKALGVGVNQISRWERGIQEPSGSNLLKMAHLYRCSPDYLLDLTDEREKQAIADTESVQTREGMRPKHHKTISRAGWQECNQQA